MAIELDETECLDLGFHLFASTTKFIFSITLTMGCKSHKNACKIVQWHAYLVCLCQRLFKKVAFSPYEVFNLGVHG